MNLCAKLLNYLHRSTVRRSLEDAFALKFALCQLGLRVLAAPTQGANPRFGERRLARVETKLGKSHAKALAKLNLRYMGRLVVQQVGVENQYSRAPNKEAIVRNLIPSPHKEIL